MTSGPRWRSCERASGLQLRCISYKLPAFRLDGRLLVALGARGGGRRTRRRSQAASPVTFETVREMALAFPGVEDGVSYGTPALKVRGKFLARLREDGTSLAIRVEFPVREALMQEEPAVFYIKDHYLNYPALLVRLTQVHPEKLRRLVEHAWRSVAPARLVRAFDDGGAGRKDARRR